VGHAIEDLVDCAQQAIRKKTFHKNGFHMMMKHFLCEFDERVHEGTHRLIAKLADAGTVVLKLARATAGLLRVERCSYDTCQVGWHFPAKM